MRRQKETCEMLFSGTSIPVVVDERLRQIDNGPQYTGMSFDIGKRDYLDFIDDRSPGESFETSRAAFASSWTKRPNNSEHTILTIGWRLSPASRAHLPGLTWRGHHRQRKHQWAFTYR